MRIIGVTGGVGAGKSTVLEMLKQEFGAELLVADEIGKRLMEPDGACFRPVAELFGREILTETGGLDRKKIAELVFQDRDRLTALNQIIHPAVRAEIEKRLSDLERDGKETAVIESAILLEAGYEEICGEIWYIYADCETRIRRLEASRGYSRKKCLEVMSNQLPEETFREKATAVIDNSGDAARTKEQIATLMAL